MALPDGVRRMLRLRSAARDVEEELSFHFERAVAELRAEGLGEAEARREAERRFGDVVAYRRELVALGRGRERAERGMRRVEAVRDVVVHAVRSVRRAPALSAAVVLTFALGLGANVTMYAIVDRLLLSPPSHVAAPEQVRRLMLEQWVEYRGERVASGILSYPDYADAKNAQSLAGVAVWSEQSLTLGHGADAREVRGVAVSGEYFDLLGVRPALGRLLREEDTQPESERTIVLSHGMWQREFGGAPDVLGRTLDFGGGPRTIVGVAPKDLTSLRLANVDMWLPLRRGTGMAFESRQFYGYAGVARLAEGVSEEAATSELTALLRRGRAELIAANRFDANGRMLLTPLLEARGPAATPEATVAKWLAAVSLIVLLVACVNVANLLLARVVRQRREIAVRLALGVSRMRLVGQILLEGAVLGVIGGAAALLLARWSGAAVGSTLLPDVAWSQLGWTRALVPLALLLAAGAGVVAACVPAVQASKRDVADTLRQAGAGGVTRGTARTRTALALLQAALSVVLLVGAGLFVRSLEAVRGLDLGVRMDRLLYVQTRFTPNSAPPEERARIAQQTLERVRALPFVEAAAAASTAPFMWAVSNNVRVPGLDSIPVIGSGDHWFVTVSGGYFDLLGITPVRGRVLDTRDIASGANVAVVNETMARALWPARDPIGQCMLVGSDTTECTEVVGVVGNTARQALREGEAMQYYLPMNPAESQPVIMVRPKAGVRDAADALRTAVAGLDPRIRYVEVIPAADRLRPQERSWRLGATLFSAFGVLALLVAALGLYAVLAFDVSQRVRELGVRAALGATPRALISLVLRRALAVAAAGAAVGAATAAVLAPRVQDLLFDVGPHDAATYIAVAGTLLLTAVIAGALPAWRAAAVDPNTALRSE